MRKIVVEFGDNGEMKIDVDPLLGISELASVSVLLAHQVDRMLDAQLQALQRKPTIVRAASVPDELTAVQ